MALKTYGLMGVDWEDRVDFDRLRKERLARIKKLLERVEYGRAPVLRYDQRALYYRNPYWHLGNGQIGPFLPAAAGR